MVLPSSMSLTAASTLAALRLSSRASWAIRSMGLLAFKVRLQHRATKDTTRPKRLFWGRATKTTYLLRLNHMGRPSLGFPKIRNPPTCGFYFSKFGMLEGDRLNVVDRPISWRTNQTEVQNSPRSRKIVGKVAKGPAGRRLLAGQRRGACWRRAKALGGEFAATRS